MKTVHTVLVVLAASMALLACSLGGGGTTTTGDTSTTTAVPPTQTTIPATCATALPGGAATTQPGGATFADMPVPATSFATAPAPISSGTGLWTISLVNVCSQGITAANVRSFFGTQLPGTGWTQTPKLPLDGGYQKPCGDPYCWAKDTAPRYVGLESVTDKGNSVTTYQLRLFVPPPVPACNPLYFGSPPIPALPGYPPFVGPIYGLYVPLPPLTTAVPSYASGGQRGYGICSAGTTASVAHFMSTELPKEGWTLFQNTSSTDQIWQHAGSKLHWSVSDPTNWELDYRIRSPILTQIGRAYSEVGSCFNETATSASTSGLMYSLQAWISAELAVYNQRKLRAAFRSLSRISPQYAQW